MPTVLIAGEELTGSIGVSFAGGFKSIGWKVHYFASSPIGALRHTVISRVAARLQSPLADAARNRRLVEEARRIRPDLSLVIKGNRIDAQTVAAVREASAIGVANFYPDDPFGGVGVNAISPGALREYSACFIFAQHLLATYAAAGVPHTHYLPFARDPELHSPPPSRTPTFDAVFVGNLDNDRAAWLESIADYKLAIFGHQTHSVISAGSPLHKAAFFPPVFGSELSEALGRGKVSLNFMRPQNAGSHNMRSFESPACGAFTLSQRTPELVKLFADGQEIVTFADTSELRRELALALEQPDRLARVSAAGFLRVEHDTYSRRAETILSQMA